MKISLVIEVYVIILLPAFLVLVSVVEANSNEEGSSDFPS